MASTLKQATLHVTTEAMLSLSPISTVKRANLCRWVGGSHRFGMRTNTSNMIKCSPSWDKQFQCAPTVKRTSLGGDHGG